MREFPSHRARLPFRQCPPRCFARRGALDIEVYPAGDMTAPDYAAEIWVPVARIPDEGCGGRISPSLSSNPPFLHGTVGFYVPLSRLLS